MDGLLYEFFWRKVSGREQELLLRAGGHSTASVQSSCRR